MLPVPWWDETLDAGHFAASDMFTNSSYFGALNPPDRSGNPTCVTNGQFAGIVDHIGPGTSNTRHCLSRAVTESLTAQCNSAYLATCAARTDYSDYESCLEYG
jgi:tyrosinase